jgi:multidrug efflux pump subunit AcrA (membrane-fusion protein)
MNDRSMRDPNDAIARDRRDGPVVGRDVVRPPRHRPRVRRRLGGRLFAFGGFLVLAGGLSLGAWGHYSRQQEVMATARQEREFVPRLPVATVKASTAVMSVALPGTTAAFAAANIYARATGYIARRNVDIGDRVKKGELLAGLAVPEISDQISQNEAILNQLKAALQQAQANLTLANVTWGRQTLGQGRLGDPAAGNNRCPDRQGAGGRSCGRAT